ncbi:6-pyruvoyl tetrahydrobiopterin synthase [Candidatus Marinamargulisbacteria bacterium SCGC AG-343-D04]|nr:6-pyruvoyl tetrahydrobiopterin synthase [Candidatus Marinamargulisbacteria bacterium SCGC AG-343-D04]
MSDGHVFLTRRIVFSASHRLYNPELSDEMNWKIFEKCSYENGHGHNYVLYVTLKGVPDIKTGMIMNVSILKKMIEEHVLNDFDHRHLNHDVEEFKTLLSSVENISIVIWNRLKPLLKDLLFEVKVVETENIFAVYRG